LDTFACRNSYGDVRVFEVDHPATQAWKMEMLRAAGIVVPETARFVAVDFEKDSLRAKLRSAGFDDSLPTVTAWLGVVPYLTLEAFQATVRLMGTLPEGSRLVFDYSQPREVLPFVEQLFFTPESLAAELDRWGMRVEEDLDGAAMTARYFAGREDGLLLRGKAGRMCVAASVGER
jgi:methyltransferase (TIGR00027 family)